MALFKISKGLSQNLPSKKVTGYCYFTTDDGKFYIDTTDNERVCLNAAAADKLTTPRIISLQGSVSGSALFDGSKNIIIKPEVYLEATGNGDDIISVTPNTAANKIEYSITHKKTNIGSGSIGNVQTPTENTFTIPQITYDQYGHITNTNSVQITLPKVDLTNYVTKEYMEDYIIEVFLNGSW